jgi:hypothetical protein
MKTKGFQNTQKSKQIMAMASLNLNSNTKYAKIKVQKIFILTTYENINIKRIK